MDGRDVRSSGGFSLSEVLIALALLGVLAAFTIPKILQTVENQQRTVLMKETMGALSAVLAEGVGKNEINISNLYSYFASRLNTIKACPTSSIDDECWDPDLAGTTPDSQFSEPGFVLASGVVVSGFSACCDRTDPGHAGAYPGENKNGILIDWNGIKSPNVVGEDQLVVILCYGSMPCRYNSRLPICTDTQHPSDFPQPAGTMMPINNKVNCDSTPAMLLKNAALYQAVFQ